MALRQSFSNSITLLNFIKNTSKHKNKAIDSFWKYIMLLNFMKNTSKHKNKDKGRERTDRPRPPEIVLQRIKRTNKILSTKIKITPR